MNFKRLLALLFIGTILLASCGEDDELPTVTASDFNVTIAENPSQGQVLGSVSITTENSNNTGFEFVNLNASGDLSNHISMDRQSGQISITNPAFFDYEMKGLIMPTQGKVTVFNSSDETATATFTITINVTDILDETGDTTGGTTLSVQQRLDNNETPIQIYNSDNSLLDSLYGKTYLGGYIFYLNTSNGTGMIVHSSAYSPARWNQDSVNFKVTGATSTAIGDGLSNTKTIVDSLGVNAVAAKVCDDIYNGGSGDWYLPTLDELKEIYNNLHAKGLGNFQSGKFWSSSELDGISAWTRDFAVSSGQTSVTSTKLNLHYFRPVRSF